MSDESAAPNPAPAESQFLEPDKKGIEDMILPGLIGVAGAALIYTSLSKKKKANGKSKPSAEDNEVKFSKSYAAYSVGKEWVELTLEPYLAEQAEEGNLTTSDYVDTMEGLTLEALQPLMADTRKRVLAAFRVTHKVGTSEGEVLISKLPDKSGVREFNEFMDVTAKEFQESY